MAVRMSPHGPLEDPDEKRKQRVRAAEDKIRKQRAETEKKAKNHSNSVGGLGFLKSSNGSSEKPAKPGDLKNIPYTAFLNPEQLLNLLQTILNPNNGPGAPSGIPFDLRECSGNNSGGVLQPQYRRLNHSGGTGSRDAVRARVEKAKAEKQKRRDEEEKKITEEKAKRANAEKGNGGKDDKKPLHGSSYSSSAWAAGSGGNGSDYTSSPYSIASGPREGTGEKVNKPDTPKPKTVTEKKLEKPKSDIGPRDPGSKVVKALIKKS